jgi:hypothetical protein
VQNLQQRHTENERLRLQLALYEEPMTEENNCLDSSNGLV